MKWLMLDISTACPAKCKYCLHQYNNLIKPQLMKYDVFLEIADILSKENYTYVHLYMSGESMLHPRIWDMIDHLSKKKIKCDLASKIFFPIDFIRVKQTFDNLNAPLHFVFTIDGYDQESQNKIAKNIDNNKVFENLKLFTQLSENNPYITIVAVTVVTSVNKGHLSLLEEKIKSCGVKKWIMKPMGYFLGYKTTNEDIKMIEEINPPDNSRFIIVDEKLVSLKKQCHLMKPVVSVEGEVSVCCHDMFYKETCGNILKTKSLDAILNSKAYQEKLILGKNLKLEICYNCN